MVRKIESKIASCPVNDTELKQIDEKTRERMAIVYQKLEEGFQKVERQEARTLEKAKLPRYR